MMKSVALLSLSLAALVGCGGDDPKKPPVVTVDAPPVTPTPDAPPSATCTMAATVPAPTFADFEHAPNDPMTPEADGAWQAISPLNADAMPDGLLIQLYEGYGTDFAAATPGTPVVVQLTGVQASYDTCAACIRGLTELTMDAYADDYFAKSGTLTLTAASATKLTGTISNLVLTHVTIDEMTLATTAVGDCDSSVGDITFDLAPAMAKNGVLTLPLRVSRSRN